MFSKFINHGVLGMNARNVLYVKPFNPKKATAFADDKLRTKAFLAARGVPAAKIYARIETRDQLRQFDFRQLPDECVLKPNFGYGGEGIIVLKGRKNGMFLRNGKEPMSDLELIEHMEDILDGKFSLGGRRDTAFFEQILIPHESFAHFRPVGLPDIRVIVFNLVPVMAMLRIPTASSEGKANLHLGGIGIGIDIAKGVTTHAAQYHNMITKLPHGNEPGGVKIPNWDDILLICSRIQYITNIGYLAVDMTLDEHMGPAVLEVNARAGLNVQVANLAPLRSRLERVKGLKVGSPEKGVQLCKDLFGGKTSNAKKEKQEDERPVLSARETITIAGSGTSVEVPCLITPDQERTIFSHDLIKKLKEKGAVETEDEKEGTYRVKFTLGGKKLQTLVGTGTVHAQDVQVTIGRRDLTGFLIDPSKGSKEPSTRSAVKTDLRAMDSLIAELDHDLLLIKYIKPINLAEERARLAQDDRYNPTFAYPEIAIDLDDAKKRLSTPIQDDSPLGILLEKKRQELLKRITLLNARGNAQEFTKASIDLFGIPSAELLKAAKAELQNHTLCTLPSDQKTLSAEEAKKVFEEVLQRYSLHDWQVSIRARLVADCTVGGKNVYVRNGAEFTQEHVASLIAHEIETHVLTAENGEHQPYALFRRGTANYLDTQEGLAIFNQNRVLGVHNERRFNPSKNILGLAFCQEHTFAQTRAYLHEELCYSKEKSLSQAITMKRGLRDTSESGGFTKSIVYFRGLQTIEEFVKKDGNLKRLYVGKISIEDLEIIEKIPDLQPPLLLPGFLQK